MLLYENTKSKIINILRMGLNPFKKFVCTGELKEELALVKSRKDILDKIINIIENDTNFILPLIGDIGVGKTHFFWALKNKLYYYNLIYIALDKIYKKFYYNIYSKFVESIGIEPLRNIISQLCNEWGALEKKYGFFHAADSNVIKKNAYSKLKTSFKDTEQSALLDVINGIVLHQLDPYKKAEAEGWLLGELMDVRELSRLNMMYDLRKNKTAFTMLKLLIENSKLGTVMFIDDFGKLISYLQFKEEATEQVFDPSWLYGETKNPDEVVSQKILKRILKLQRIKGLRIIVSLKNVKILEEIKNKFKELDEENVKMFYDPIFVPTFEESDIFEFYNENMKLFYENLKLSDFLDELLENFYPLNHQVLKYIYDKSKGNPREIIKNLIKVFNTIIFSNKDVGVLIKEFEGEWD
jgi:hypothetical protein